MHLQPAGRYITEETDPTVPDWAKKPEKPTYTASEVGALPAGTKIPSKTSDLTNDSGFITKNEVYIGTVEPSVDEGYAVWINPEEDNGYIQQPSTDGESGQVLTSDGNGGTYWSSMSGSGGSGIETSLELVWTNPTQGTSSAQVFGAQTVNVDLSNYKAVMIEFVMTAGYSSRVCQIFMIGSTGRAITLSYNDTDVNLPTGTLCYDRIVKPTISGIQFLDCNVNATTVINKCLFPLRVYGIK